MTTRRRFIAALAATAALPGRSWAEAGAPAALSCAREPDGTFALFGIRADGSLAFRQALPTRGHAGARHPGRAEAVVFARRPGRWALVLDCVTGAPVARLEPPPGIQFNGHGAYLQGGGLLVTAEQLAATSEGQLGLWAADEGYARIGAVPSGGIGPHEVLALPGGGLAIANGGIATDPSDRTKLNIPDMRPNLAFTDDQARLTDLLDPVPEARQASIRHLAVLSGGQVAAGMQWEGEGPPPPLLSLAQPGGRLEPASAPEGLWAALGGYVGSVAAAGALVAVSSPRGGRAALFAADGTLADQVERTDICGLAALNDDSILASDGGGALLTLRVGQRDLVARHRLAWDNHLLAV